jgi:hypothetical protein
MLVKKGGTWKLKERKLKCINITGGRKLYLVVLFVDIKPQRLCSFLNSRHNFICGAMRSNTGFSFHKTLEQTKRGEEENSGSNNEL